MPLIRKEEVIVLISHTAAGLDTGHSYTKTAVFASRGF